MPPNNSNNSSALPLTLLNLIKPSATAIVAILTAPLVVSSKKIETIEIIAATMTGIMEEVTKRLFVPLIFNDAKNVKMIEITNVIAMMIKETTILFVLGKRLNNESILRSPFHASF